MAAVRERIKAATDRRFVGAFRGRGGGERERGAQAVGLYYRHGNSSRCFSAIDRYAHERLALFPSAKHERPGRNWASRYDWA